ncbi:hypothetical protein LTR37_001599 [Vermiconidia calcicola]|uniref:Uncharacterized protein n=1 Tax=Vermiconidia calcicola TaxID=1690605 RepID=A0ACC3NVR8_9PEZI|nr:hypothetical protein LTR37_001599 [Vermiconidia calcicola]
MASPSLLGLPKDVLVLLPSYLHNIEDYMNVASTCRTLRDCMDAATPNSILRLAAAQSRNFFRPSPHFLVCATAREIGNWARRSDENEAEFALKMENGVDALLDLALEHCGLTMQRIRELHLMRFSIINPVTNIIDQCVGKQWYAAPGFWDGGRSDAYTIDSDPPVHLFQLAIYGELFAPDLEALLDRDSETRRLRVETRLEYIKYCIPDYATEGGAEDSAAELDPRRAVKQTGPYDVRAEGFDTQNNIALTWVLKSSRWRPHWKAMRAIAGEPDFVPDWKGDYWWWDGTPSEEGEDPEVWRQRLLEDVMVCQGLEGLEMTRPGLRDAWVEKVRAWRAKVARLEKEPDAVKVGWQATMEYPFLLGDLRICASGKDTLKQDPKSRVSRGSSS